jgi:hypothetical protein
VPLNRDLAFISYAKEDLNLVLKLYEGLKERAVNVWLDKEDLEKGKWRPQIKSAIARSNNFILCLSKVSLKKMAKGKGIMPDKFSFAYEIAVNKSEYAFTILPIRLEDCDEISNFHQYDLFPDLGKGLDEIAVNLGGISLSDTRAIDERTEDEKMLAGIMGKVVTLKLLGRVEEAIKIYDKAIKQKQ